MIIENKMSIFSLLTEAHLILTGLGGLLIRDFNFQRSSARN